MTARTMHRPLKAPSCHTTAEPSPICGWAWDRGAACRNYFRPDAAATAEWHTPGCVRPVMCSRARRALDISAGILEALTPDRRGPAPVLMLAAPVSETVSGEEVAV